MPTYTQPPPALESAIQSASSKYGDPPDLLTGIWRVESGSSYPNPYVNSSGYGGLFGTRNWNAPTGAQADTAAQILASQLLSHGGDVAGALSSYSGGGYTSVPGETTTHVDTSKLHVAAGRSGGINTGSSTGAGPVGDAVVGAKNAVTGAVTGWVNDIINWIKLYTLRFAEVVGGGLLILGGLFLVSGIGSSAAGAAVARAV